MNKIEIKGLIKIEDMEFHHIEGGFGKDKKAILAKEIAEIHKKKLKVINQAINMNRKRFKDGIDIIDVKGTDFEVNLIDHGIYNQNSINRSSNIYVLSERGYAKLLKILEDDFAWDQYEKLVDNYFNMRRTIKNFQLNNENEEEKRWKFDFTVSLLKNFGEALSPESKVAFIANITEELFGRPMLPKPEVRKTITSSELAEKLGISVQRFGRLITKAGGIRNNPDYGISVLDKSRYSDKNVVNFIYYEDKVDSIINRILPLLEEEQKTKRQENKKSLSF